MFASLCLSQFRPVQVLGDLRQLHVDCLGLPAPAGATVKSNHHANLGPIVAAVPQRLDVHEDILRRATIGLNEAKPAIIKPPNNCPAFQL